MKLFSGAATAIARSGKSAGTLRLRATAPGVKAAELLIPVE
jgi:beta-galactosidase